MTDDPVFGLTVLRCSEDYYAVKRIHADPSRPPKPYRNATYWTFIPVAPVGYKGLHWLLNRMTDDPHAMLIRGAPFDDLDLSQEHVRQWASDTPTIQAVSRNLLTLDFDDVPVPEGLEAADKLMEAGLYVRDYILPEEFYGVGMLAMASAGTGRTEKGEARLRLFTWIDRHIPDYLLKEWAIGFKNTVNRTLDPAILQPGQPIYTGRPIFEGGAVDPVPRDKRVVVLNGEHRPVELDLTRYRDAFQSEVRATNAAIKEANGNWRVVADKTVGVNLVAVNKDEEKDASRFHMPLRTVIGLAAMDPGVCLADVTGYLLPLIAQRADRKRQYHYNHRWIDQAFKSFTKRELQRHGVGGAVARELTQDDYDFWLK